MLFRSHLCRDCDVAQECDVFGMDVVLSLLQECGLSECENFAGFAEYTSVPCFVDGVLLGHLPEVDLDDQEGRSGSCFNLMQHLRRLKSDGSVSNSTEICYISSNNQIRMMGQFSVFTQQNRYVRRVWNLSTGKEELIGSLEQLFLDIALVQTDVQLPFTTHQELTPVQMLSATA